MALRKIAIIPSSLTTTVANNYNYCLSLWRPVRNAETKFEKKICTDRYHAVATLPAVRDATKFRRTTDDISRTRPDERTRFTITMSPFHGHTPTSATAFDSAAPVWWGPGGGGSVVHSSRRE
uniref:Uncharacterized protein n=1 Tax=Schizaphis graminum TaxID=13262 RepID=A0A2S2NSV4_SCHGA